ncbi:MAG: electron transport complex subunit RsxC [Gammaproteobacteria bacterium]|nr:electron transport complex subunit RsxC [Gammaproteobacteria bacterium]
MSQLFDFPGGVHPPANKQISKPGQIFELPLPEQLLIPLAQHIGAPAEPTVKAGDLVNKGQLIAKAKGSTSAHIHAPTSGTISNIDAYPIAHASGLKETCIALQADGKDTWHTAITQADPSMLDIQQIDQRIAAAGIIGMGGAGFPSSAKLATKKPIQTLIINGVECEPYITADDTLMQLESQAIIKGACLLLRLLPTAKCILVIEDNKPQAIAAMREAAEHSAIEVVVIPTKYPSGGEKQLIQNITGKQVPKGGIPADLGVLCLNVATVKAIYDAVYLGRPSIDRITTVTGNGVKQPGNYRILVGTSVDFLLSHCQADTSASQVVLGGPMMGFQLPDLQVPLIKTSNCLIVPDAQELPASNSPMACIRCGQCELACPAQLLPQQLYWLAKADAFDKIEQYNLMDCIECGACAYVCPSQIPLVQHYRYAKGKLRQQALESRQAEHAKLRFEAREQRLIDEQQAKEDRRKARAAAAAAAQAAKRSAKQDSDDPVAAAQARIAAKKQAANAPAKSKQNTVEQIAKPSHKDLKTAAAIARTKLKKAQKALTEAQASDHQDSAKLQATVQDLTTRSEAAAQALAHFESQLGVDPEAIKQAQVSWAKANAQVRKLTKSAPDETADAEQQEEYQQALMSAQQNLAKAQTHLHSLKHPTKEPSQ